MAHHLVEKETLVRANVAVLLGLVWGGLAASVIVACVYDVGRWLAVW